eukprot:TRINITY_DN56626_c0_g1_i1.p1 TRINITY_DN56626_c0_g1~~TRINITY_DN56626_c0_g1_i1.p1  ORF type:complete len:540 (-),score=83.76 TRINITY_DN56626_c0_g1_i1:33-1481(-)
MATSAAAVMGIAGLAVRGTLVPGDCPVALDGRVGVAASVARERLADAGRLSEFDARVQGEALRAAELRETIAEQHEHLRERPPEVCGKDGVVSAEHVTKCWGHHDAVAEGNAQMARECMELKAQAAALREEGVELERRCQASHEAAARERHECAQLQTELDVERKNTEQAELQASELQRTVDESQARAGNVRQEVALAVAKNAFLEEQCAEATAEICRTRSSTAAARKRLEDLGAQMAILRGVVREHARRVGQRLTDLEKSMDEMPTIPRSSPPNKFGSRNGCEAVAVAAFSNQEPAAKLVSRSKIQSAKIPLVTNSGSRCFNSPTGFAKVVGNDVGENAASGATFGNRDADAGGCGSVGVSCGAAPARSHIKANVVRGSATEGKAGCVGGGFIPPSSEDPTVVVQSGHRSLEGCFGFDGGPHPQSPDEPCWIPATLDAVPPLAKKCRRSCSPDRLNNGHEVGGVYWSALSAQASGGVGNSA